MATQSELPRRALNRFGMGARVGESQSLHDPRDWLEGQLTANVDPMRAPEIPAPAEIGAALRSLREAQGAGDGERVQAARRRIREIAGLEARAALTERVRSDHPFVERLVAFWSNHLCVSIAGKPIVAPLAGLYERQVIRPHVLSRFEDMVLASARHPAMLLYLDNAQSLGPNSRVGQATRRRQRRVRGLNENYARELLELHTLGVDGGYSQQDVQELARILTGWTVDGVGGPQPGREPQGGEPGFRFVPAMHEPGTKVVLGKRYRDGGEREGREVIRDLCRHPSTAAFVSRKLVRHFVSDEPEERDVTAVATVFRDTGGDLRAVARSLIHIDAAWDQAHLKFRTPQDWLIAALRAVGARDYPVQLVPMLRALRHPLWAPAAPKGFGDTRSEWADPDGLMNRAELGRTIATQVARRGFEPERLLDTIDMQDASSLPQLIGDETIERGERVALFLSGPDFQWR